MSNRDRINLLPHGGSSYARYRWTEAQRALDGTQWEAVALIYCGGTLVRHRQTGLLAEYFGISQPLASVHQRKAQAALAEMEAEEHDPT